MRCVSLLFGDGIHRWHAQYALDFNTASGFFCAYDKAVFICSLAGCWILFSILALTQWETENKIFCPLTDEWWSILIRLQPIKISRQSDLCCVLFPTPENMSYLICSSEHISRFVWIFCFLLGEWFCLLFRREHHWEWSSQSVITFLCSATPVACYFASLIPPARFSSQMPECPALRNKEWNVSLCIFMTSLQYIYI